MSLFDSSLAVPMGLSSKKRASALSYMTFHISNLNILLSMVRLTENDIFTAGNILRGHASLPPDVLQVMTLESRQGRWPAPSHPVRQQHSRDEERGFANAVTCSLQPTVLIFIQTRVFPLHRITSVFHSSQEESEFK